MESLTLLIIEYRYWFLIPLTFLEGPIVALLAGTLAAAHYFDIYLLALIFIIREVVMDGVYYALGYYGGKIVWVQKMLHRAGIHEDHLDDIRLLWERYPFRTMFVGKISYGIALVFILCAGFIRMNLWRFYGYGMVVAVIQYGVLLAIGYGYGNAFSGDLIHMFEQAHYLIALITLIGVIYYVLAKRAKRKLFEVSG